MADKTTGGSGSGTGPSSAANMRFVMISMGLWFVCALGFDITLRPTSLGMSVGGADPGVGFALSAMPVMILLTLVHAAVTDRHHRERSGSRALLGCRAMTPVMR